jgi:pimeloyl-ACP methyl ester carboxylesterase
LATFVLIHGADDSAWYWHLLEPELRDRGHEVVTMDLPCDDDSAGLTEYADAVIDAIGDRRDLVVVQSFGGFTAPLVCVRVPVDLMVLVAPMIPAPAEAPDRHRSSQALVGSLRYCYQVTDPVPGLLVGFGALPTSHVLAACQTLRSALLQAQHPRVDDGQRWTLSLHLQGRRSAGGHRDPLLQPVRLPAR